MTLTFYLSFVVDSDIYIFPPRTFSNQKKNPGPSLLFEPSSSHFLSLLLSYCPNVYSPMSTLILCSFSLPSVVAKPFPTFSPFQLLNPIPTAFKYSYVNYVYPELRKSNCRLSFSKAGMAALERTSGESTLERGKEAFF
jgi:hypothetical protein